MPSVSPAPSSPAVSQKRSSTHAIPTAPGSDSDSAQLPFIPSASSYHRASDDEDSSDSIISCDEMERDRSMEGGAEYDFEVGPPSWLSSSSYTSSSGNSSSSSDTEWQTTWTILHKTIINLLQCIIDLQNIFVKMLFVVWIVFFIKCVCIGTLLHRLPPPLDTSPRLTLLPAEPLPVHEECHFS